MPKTGNSSLATIDADYGIKRQLSSHVARVLRKSSGCLYHDEAKLLDHTPSECIPRPSPVDQCKDIIEGKIGHSYGLATPWIMEISSVPRAFPEFHGIFPTGSFYIDVLNAQA